MTTTFIEEIERHIETTQTKRSETKTLAEAVSNELMQNGLPRISPELFELQRQANLTLTPEQIKKIDRHYDLISPGSKKQEPSRKYFAEIPRFITAYLPDEKEIMFKEYGKILYSSHFNFKSLESISLHANRSLLVMNSSGRKELEIKINWTPTFCLNVAVQAPIVPESFIDLGDDAIAKYYDTLRQVSPELRRKTTLTSPRLKVLWAPTDETLYCTGEIPEPIPPRPKGDPALILDIPDGERSYRHVVAVWDIGQELPFRNWLAEYSEGRRK